MEVYLNNDDEVIAGLSLEPESAEYAFNFPRDKIVRGENIITFRYSHLEKPDAQDPAAERKDPRAVYFEWISFPDAGSSRKHIYRQEDSILINPLARMRYHLRVPEEGRLKFALDFPDQPRAPETLDVDLIFSVSIQEEGSLSEMIFEEHMTAASVSRKRHEVDLARHAGRIVQLTFQLECPAAPGTTPNTIYARIGRPTVEGYDRLPRPSGDVSKRPELRRIEKNNLIFIILDAANPTHFGSYGYERDTTPNMDRLDPFFLGVCPCPQYPGLHRIPLHLHLPTRTQGDRSGYDAVRLGCFMGGGAERRWNQDLGRDLEHPGLSCL
jgi:hypothetical protein